MHCGQRGRDRPGPGRQAPRPVTRKVGYGYVAALTDPCGAWAVSSVSPRSTCGFRYARNATGGWPGSRPAMTIRRAVV
jgi:hypothetical protein